MCCPTSCDHGCESSLRYGRRDGVPARAGAYYASPGNSFWKTLHSAGLTQVRLSPADFDQLPAFGVGLTDICKVFHGPDEEVGTGEFDAAGLEARITAAEPANLAFNGRMPPAGRLAVEWITGLSRSESAGAAVWVLPSTRGGAKVWGCRAVA